MLQCLLRFDETSGCLSTYNLGDSGFLLFSRDPTRGGRRLAGRSSPQSHADNGAPYQLIGGMNAEYSDRASSGAASSFALSEGMLALVHTDGLTDNLSVSEVGELIEELHDEKQKKKSGERGDLGALARGLASAANKRKRQPDDVTVIAIRVEAR